MSDFVMRSFQMDDANWFLLLVMSGIAIYIIHTMIDDMTVTLVSAPAIMMFAAVARQIMIELGFQLTTDKAVNGGFGFGVGILAFSLLMAIIFVVRSAYLRN